MKKKLVFAFYLGKNFKDEIIEIHLKCIERFSNVFDEAEIAFIVDDGYNRADLLYAQERLINAFLGKKITFSFFENGPYRESIVFKELIADRLSSEDLVFFAHSKGMSNVEKYDREQIYVWVSAMYYYSLNFMDEVDRNLLNEKYYSYGPFLTKNNEPEKCNKYGWYYIGTFFWINCKKLWQYMQNNEIPLPKMGDRFYDEEFLGNIIPTWPLVFTSSHETRYLIDCKDYYHNAKEYLMFLHNSDIEGFKEFYNSLGLVWKD